jgi:hypothetical protein
MHPIKPNNKVISSTSMSRFDTEVATAPKEVEAPTEITRTLLVAPLTTVVDIVNLAGT